MFPFRKKRKLPEVDPATADHLFDAVPEKTANVEAKEDATGALQLKVELKRPTGLAGFVARTLRFRNTVRVNLDERGSQFWALIDGQRKLRDIERTIRKDWNLSADDSRRATVQFTKMLMTRHLVNLRIPHAEAPHAD